jgi:hypothetical protein
MPAKKAAPAKKTGGGTSGAKAPKKKPRSPSRRTK